LDIMDQLASPSRKDILGDINEVLDQIQASGSFASFAGIPSLGVGDQLGLFVHGVGHISLPLQDAQARQLIAQSRQAPYGKGSDTIVDTSVRNTWELDTSQFEFRNAAWAKTVDRCVSHAGKALGITAETPIKAEPYKMLIYEAGAMFKAHTESIPPPPSGRRIAGTDGWIVPRRSRACLGPLLSAFRLRIAVATSS
jgi:hypothetical protein